MRVQTCLKLELAKDTQGKPGTITFEGSGVSFTAPGGGSWSLEADLTAEEASALARHFSSLSAVLRGPVVTLDPNDGLLSGHGALDTVTSSD